MKKQKTKTTLGGGATIFGGKYPGDRTEVIRVFPTYKTLSKTKKRNILALLKLWVENELLCLPPLSKKVIKKKR